jgi:hypothetical protein
MILNHSCELWRPSIHYVWVANFSHLNSPGAARKVLYAA